MTLALEGRPIVNTEAQCHEETSIPDDLTVLSEQRAG